MRPTRLLCTGDLHLGRRPSRVPDQSPEFTVVAVWDRIVEHAVEQRVDALVLTGDVADHDNAFFEAYGHLEKGFRRLVDAGIPIVAVAGNHDVEVLGRLVDALGSPLLHLLGRGGLWETLRLAPEGATPMRLLGWSFRTPHETASPLDHPTLAEALEGHADHEPLVGVLHADLDVAGSRYAPVTTAQLLAVPTGAWLLGHIHVPRLHEPSGRPVLYPGSPQPLDPGETGRRGPWAITVHADGRVEAEMVPMATVRYATWEVPVDGVEDKATLERTLIEALVAQLEACAGEQPSLRHLVARMHLVGRAVVWRRCCRGGAPEALRRRRPCLGRSLARRARQARRPGGAGAVRCRLGDVPRPGRRAMRGTGGRREGAGGCVARTSD